MTLEFCLLACGCPSASTAYLPPPSENGNVNTPNRTHINSKDCFTPHWGAKENKQTNKQKKKENSAFWLKKICVRFFRGGYTARGAKPRAPLPLRSSHKSKHLLPHVVSLRRSETFLQLRRYSHQPEVVATTFTSVTDGRVHRRRTLLQKTPQKRTTRRFQTSSTP